MKDAVISLPLGNSPRHRKGNWQEEIENNEEIDQKRLPSYELWGGGDGDMKSLVSSPFPTRTTSSRQDTTEKILEHGSEAQAPQRRGRRQEKGKRNSYALTTLPLPRLP